MTPALKTVPYRPRAGWTMGYDVYAERGELQPDGGGAAAPVEPGMISRGGLVLRDMRHDGFTFAEQVRVIGIWVFPKDTARHQPKFLVLGPPDFVQQPGVAGSPFDPYSPVLSLEKTGAAPRQFAVYNALDELKVVHTTRLPVFPDDAGKGTHLTVVQRALFTGYSDAPAHEPIGAAPGGALAAARFFPLVWLGYPGADVKAIRVDYYVDLQVEGHIDPASRATVGHWYRRNDIPFPNQAGVFRDDDTPFLGDLIKEGIGIAFSAVEKPMLHEIYSIGLWRGGNIIPETAGGTGSAPEQDRNEIFPRQYLGWDNIHWWGSRGQGRPIISAIGAFHAAHIHWRWARVPQQLAILFGRLRQFRGDDLERGGPLLDPALPLQTLRFAIAKHRDDRDPDQIEPAKLSQRHFSQLFMQDNPRPDRISDPDSNRYQGADLVMWLSVEVEVEEAPFKTLSGTLLPHGFFFAHSPEPSFSAGGFKTGTDQPEYKPELPSDQWLRLAP
jgi:hypothetical protein